MKKPFLITTPPTLPIGVIGGGPAGLKAAETLVELGYKVLVFDRMPSVGRKFLVAGSGGLNLSHSEPLEWFVARYSGNKDQWRELIGGWSAENSQKWAHSLGIETYIGTSGRIFPVNHQAAPLLRRWVEKLRKNGVQFLTRYEFVDFKTSPHPVLFFKHGNAMAEFSVAAAIFALGGGSWPQTGSNGNWISIFEKNNITVNPLEPANCGWDVNWPSGLVKTAEGLPLKNIMARCEDKTVAGECIITGYGLEGGVVYQLGPQLRKHRYIEIDLKPDLTEERLLQKLGGISDTPDLIEFASARWKLNIASKTLLHFFAANSPVEELIRKTKCIRIPLQNPRPIAEVISSAGGVAWNELDNKLMLKKHPGIFVAGEMIDWEAPTGGYLLQGCLATGHRAATGVHSLLKGDQLQIS